MGFSAPHALTRVAAGHAYFDIQATTPQTVAYGITDSPVGLLAWLYEKLARWTGDYAWTEDEGAPLPPLSPSSPSPPLPLIQCTVDADTGA